MQPDFPPEISWQVMLERSCGTRTLTSSINNPDLNLDDDYWMSLEQCKKVVVAGKDESIISK